MWSVYTAQSQRDRTAVDSEKLISWSGIQQAALPALSTVQSLHSHSQGSSTAMVARLPVLLCILHLTVGLQVQEDTLEDKLEKVLEDTIQNTELDAEDIVDFPAWSSSGDDITEKTGQDSQEVKEEAQDKNEEPGSIRLTDLIEKYLTNNLKPSPYIT